MKNTLLLLILLPVLGFSQEKSDASHWEIGLNSTQLLRNLFAQNPSGLIGDYTFFIKKGRENKLFRAHFGGNINTRHEDFSNFSQQIESKNSEIRLGIGFENRRFIYKKLQLVWGGDLLPSYSIDQSETRIFFSSQTSDVKNTLETYGFGLGPIIGLRFEFSKYFSISTESSLYLLYSQTRNETKENGADIMSKTSTHLNVSHTLPHSLFVVMSF